MQQRSTFAGKNTTLSNMREREEDVALLQVTVLLRRERKTYKIVLAFNFMLILAVQKPSANTLVTTACYGGRHEVEEDCDWSRTYVLY